MNALKDYVNWKLTHADKVAEAEGYPLTMENCKKNKRMKQLKLWGSSQGIGDLVNDATDVNLGKYKIPILQRGINLFDSDLWLTYFDKLEDGSYHSKHNINTSQTIPFNLKAGTYRLSVELKCPDNTRYRPYMKDADGKAIYTNYTVTGKGEWEKLSFTFTSAKDAVSMYWTYNANTDDLSFRNFQIEKGSLETPYEPYAEPVETNVFLSKPLFSTDYVDFKNKKAVYDTGSFEEELPDIVLPKLTVKSTIIEVKTSVLPLVIYGKYIKK